MYKILFFCWYYPMWGWIYGIFPSSLWKIVRWAVIYFRPWNMHTLWYVCLDRGTGMPTFRLKGCIKILVQHRFVDKIIYPKWRKPTWNILCKYNLELVGLEPAGSSVRFTVHEMYKETLTVLTVTEGQSWYVDNQRNIEQ